jgi:hypothetical protein
MLDGKWVVLTIPRAKVNVFGSALLFQVGESRSDFLDLCPSFNFGRYR